MLTTLKDLFVNKYPEKYEKRIQALKVYTEEEIAKCVQEILTKPQWIVHRSEKMLLLEAVQEARNEGRNMIEIEAPLLTFPRATKEKWNGTIDHCDTITGMYHLYIGEEYTTHYGDHLLKTFKGGPKIVPALKKALGCNITMIVDAEKSPASRFIIII